MDSKNGESENVYESTANSDSAELGYPTNQAGEICPIPYEVHDAEVERIGSKSRILRNLRRAEIWFENKVGIEAMGVERIPADQRHPPNYINMMLLWLSMNTNPATLPYGLLGPLYGLSVNESIIISVFGAILGSCLPSWTATLSVPTGLRQIAVSRFTFGIWGAKLCGLLNIMVNLGFGVVNVIVGGQLLRAVSGGTLPLAVGIVIILLCAWLISFFGFRVLHHYEKYAWILIAILFCVLYGQSRPFFSPTPEVATATGIDHTGAALSYFTLIFSGTMGWSTMAGDYYVHYPADTNKWLVFGLTELGLVTPTIFVFILGNFMGGIVTTNDNLGTIYTDGGIGALILACMTPSGWGKFACVIFTLSFIATMAAIIYSSALSVQLWGNHFMAVPRSIWTTVHASICLALAWGGRNILETVLSNFLSMLGYWVIGFVGCMFIEHYYFRPRNGGYDVDNWQNQAKMPIGLAGVLTMLTGYGMSFIGMVQTWYIGPVAQKFGTYGGDVGDYFVIVTVAILYPILRTLELKFFGR